MDLGFSLFLLSSLDKRYINPPPATQGISTKHRTTTASAVCICRFMLSFEPMYVWFHRLWGNDRTRTSTIPTVSDYPPKPGELYANVYLSLVRKMLRNHHCEGKNLQSKSTVPADYSYTREQVGFSTKWMLIWKKACKISINVHEYNYTVLSSLWVPAKAAAICSLVMEHALIIECLVVLSIIIYSAFQRNVFLLHIILLRNKLSLKLVHRKTERKTVHSPSLFKNKCRRSPLSISCGWHENCQRKTRNAINQLPGLPL